MPVYQGKDKKGCYYKVRNVKNKYYFIKTSKASRERAKRKATKQLQAIKINQRR
jgi:hypothetical protein